MSYDVSLCAALSHQTEHLLPPPPRRYSYTVDVAEAGEYSATLFASSHHGGDLSFDVDMEVKAWEWMGRSSSCFWFWARWSAHSTQMYTYITGRHRQRHRLLHRLVAQLQRTCSDWWLRLGVCAIGVEAWAE